MSKIITNNGTSVANASFRLLSPAMACYRPVSRFFCRSKVDDDNKSRTEQPVDVRISKSGRRTSRVSRRRNTSMVEGGPKYRAWQIRLVFCSAHDVLTGETKGVSGSHRPLGPSAPRQMPIQYGGPKRLIDPRCGGIRSSHCSGVALLPLHCSPLLKSQHVVNHTCLAKRHSNSNHGSQWLYRLSYR